MWKNTNDELDVELSFDPRLKKASNVSSNDKLDLRNYKVIEIDNEPWALCSVNDKYLLTSNYFQSNLTLFDENFKKIKTIDKIENSSFKALSLATNNIDMIYISDFEHNRIIVCNYDFKLLFKMGKRGSGNTQFNGPSGIFYYEKNLFVCDANNQRIQKFDGVELNYLKTYKTDINPYSIKITNSIAAVKEEDGNIVYIYDMPDFNLKFKYERDGCVFVYKSLFCQFEFQCMKMHCYDERAKKYDEISLVGLDEINFDDWTCCEQFRDKLVICPGSSFKMIIV